MVDVNNRCFFFSIQALLSAPNPDDPLSENIAKHWKSNEAEAVETGNLSFHYVPVQSRTLKAFAICPWFSFLSSTLQLKNGHVFMQVVPEDHKLVKKKPVECYRSTVKSEWDLGGLKLNALNYPSKIVSLSLKLYNWTMHLFFKLNWSLLLDQKWF